MINRSIGEEAFDLVVSPAENYRIIREEVAETARKCGRNPAEVEIVLVTKTVSADAVRQVAEVGARMVGENRVQEAQKKRALLSDLPLEWHLIGHLQTNKVKPAIELFSLIHSVDRLALAEALSGEAMKVGKVQEVLVQVNVSGEESKFGLPYDGALERIREISQFPGIRVKGLMTIAPYGPKEGARIHFRRLRELFEEAKSLPRVEMSVLSMGMTNDYSVAIEEGATLLRIGTAIFGERSML